MLVPGSFARLARQSAFPPSSNISELVRGQA